MRHLVATIPPRLASQPSCQPSQTLACLRAARVVVGLWCRVGVFYGPLSGPLTKDVHVADAVRGLFSHMNASLAGSAFTPVIEFNVGKK